MKTTVIRRILLTLLKLSAAGLPLIATAQTPPSLKSLAANHGSIVAGDVTITNFHTPKEFPTHFLDVIVPDDGDNVAVSANVRPDGNVDLVFTAIDPATGIPSPMTIDAANTSKAPANRLFMMQYDVVVTNPQLALHAVDRSFGPGTVTTGATGAFNYAYSYTGMYSGAIYGLVHYFFDTAAGGVRNFNSWTTGPGPALFPATYSQTPGSVGVPATFGDISAAKLGNEWGLGSGPWGGIRIGDASLDSMTVTLILAPTVPPTAGAAPGILGFTASSVFLTSPAGSGGATLALSATRGVFNGQVVTVPPSVTVPEGSTYTSWPITKDPATTIVDATTITGIFNGVSVTAGYEFFPDVYPPAQPQVIIAKTGTGKGTVSSSDGVIACGSKCAGTYALGRGVMLTAQPASGSTFTGWTGGACAGSTAATCVLAVADFATLVTAQFDAVANGGGGGGGGGGGSQVTLSVNRSNAGTVTASPSGNDRALDCGSVCAVKFTQGTAITLTATPPAGKTFAGWAGACSGAAPTCTLTISKDTAVQANFSK
jgi:hypothetical protein